MDKHPASDLKDPQRDAVYDWEGEFRDWNRRTLPLRLVKKYVQDACAHYGLPAPTVKGHPGKAYAFYKPKDDYSGELISFAGWCQNPAVALHEAAHYIVLHHFGKDVQDHGPIWLGVYLWLLQRAGIAPQEALRASARKWKLRWRDMPPERVVKRQRRLELETAPALLRTVVQARRSRLGGRDPT